MKILINGAAGAMGLELCRLLQAHYAGGEVAALVDPKGGQGIYPSFSQVPDVQGTVLDFSFHTGFSDEERESFTRLLDAGFTDTFRLLYPDLTGAYSWWSYRFNARKNNAGWRIDYFLVSNALRNRVSQARIHGEILGSDHCPVELELNWEASTP